MKLKTKNIFLDTNIYEENNFFHSSNIQALFHYSKIGMIDLYMTSISRMELIDRMKKGLTDVKNEYNQLVNFINKTRILRNLNEFEKIEKSKLTIEKSIKELTNKLNYIIETSNIQIINADYVKVEEVFEHFYKQESPFSNNSKKHEFPDAFIIESINSWCKTKKKKMVFVTKDTDFSNYTSKHLIFRADLSQLLSDITADFDAKQESQYIPFINNSLKENQIELLELIDSEIESLICLNLDFEKVSDFKKENVKFIDYKIISIRPKYAEVTLNIELNISFTIIPTATEIEKSFFEDSLKPKKFSYRQPIPCELEIGLNKRNEIKLKWINSNQKLYIDFKK
ncbi:MAG TPA: hypothetical protein DCR43_05600 [Bacteroidales bacterium]|nr:MAG: hypothetical protein A2X11_12250 [Bacteroidetes bacterium GWE2_42_24]OFY32457.1 MAG: hypothetical protein A2X09_07995 [Bacteroidetes bacterium GWF2_43_11]HAQ65309.1 hypothetical protein [Bacteroidales bacterium]HBZ65424.1 hypothetical protein [Bacteroidales bacterium]